MFLLGIRLSVLLKKSGRHRHVFQAYVHRDCEGLKQLTVNVC